MYPKHKMCKTINYRVRANQKRTGFSCLTANLRTFLTGMRTSHVLSTPLWNLYLALLIYTFWITQTGDTLLKIIMFTDIKYLDCVWCSRSIHNNNKYCCNHIAFYVSSSNALNNHDVGLNSTTKCSRYITGTLV